MALDILSKMHHINRDKQLLLSHDIFYMPELDQFDIQTDYIHWISESSVSISYFYSLVKILFTLLVFNYINVWYFVAS